MTGLCCRHQVRHDDELCCPHGIIHRDADQPATLLGVQRPAEYDCPSCGRPRASDPCEHCGDSESGGVLLAGLAIGVLFGCATIGQANVDPWLKFGAGVALVALGAPLLHWLLADVDVERHPAAHRPGRATHPEDRR